MTKKLIKNCHKGRHLHKQQHTRYTRQLHRLGIQFKEVISAKSEYRFVLEETGDLVEFVTVLSPFSGEMSFVCVKNRVTSTLTFLTETKRLQDTN